MVISVRRIPIPDAFWTGHDVRIINNVGYQTKATKKYAVNSGSLWQKKTRKKFRILIFMSCFGAPKNLKLPHRKTLIDAHTMTDFFFGSFQRKFRSISVEINHIGNAEQRRLSRNFIRHTWIVKKC